MTKFRIAVVGLGWWGKVMVDRLTKSHHVEITVLVDPFPDTSITNTADILGINIVENIETAVNEYAIDQHNPKGRLREVDRETSQAELIRRCGHLHCLPSPLRMIHQ
mgnify:CR=1 FL=1